MIPFIIALAYKIMAVVAGYKTHLSIYQDIIESKFFEHQSCWSDFCMIKILLSRPRKNQIGSI